MNWLAHLYLSEPNPEFRLGNLLADIAPNESLASLPDGFQRGIVQHRRIDAFTDSHPVVRRSIQRFAPPLRRFGSILCDVFYDHFLARDWDAYSSEPLSTFSQSVYGSFDAYRPIISPDAYSRLEQMRAGDWLCLYRELAGVAHALERIGSRLRRPVDFSQGVSALQRDYESLHADFRTFFPELSSHVSASSCRSANSAGCCGAERCRGT
jgi:acyl carrier protein phosphodiesterase